MTDDDVARLRASLTWSPMSTQAGSVRRRPWGSCRSTPVRGRSWKAAPARTSGFWRPAPGESARVVIHDWHVRSARGAGARPDGAAPSARDRPGHRGGHGAGDQKGWQAASPRVRPAPEPRARRAQGSVPSPGVGGAVMRAAVGRSASARGRHRLCDLGENANRGRYRPGHNAEIGARRGAAARCSTSRTALGSRSPRVPACNRSLIAVAHV